MKRHIKLAVVFAIGVLSLAAFATVVLADRKSEEQPSKGKTVAKVTASEEMSEILEHYFAMRNLLAHDKAEGLAKEAKQMTQRLDGLIKALQAIRSASDGVKADHLKKTREGFGPLSDAVLNYVKEFGFSGEAYSFYCSMVGKGWLQEHDQIGNPYYGSQMYKCGDMTGMTMNGKFVEKEAGESEQKTHLKEMEGK